ncbi:hypothetical protein EB796_000611 [Bugula neritina]|uniref:Uncharacterized protein n=1 Tax=Bugula neritina TaxID=10212 RepID=A0A7J7KSA3_BUGNE|nr:hypothetical protein EB796_000611 [Bugula neritina]
MQASRSALSTSHHFNMVASCWRARHGLYKLYVACKEIKKYLHADYNDEIFTEQMMVLEQESGHNKNYTGNRGARGRGGNRGMMQGRGAEVET